VIRQHADPHQFITTNTMHWNGGFDHYMMHRSLDLASWDEYVANGHYGWLDYAVQHDLVRGYKRRNFWLMETQPGFVNWWPVNRSSTRGRCVKSPGRPSVTAPTRCCIGNGVAR